MKQKKIKKKSTTLLYQPSTLTKQLACVIFFSRLSETAAWFCVHAGMSVVLCVHECECALKQKVSPAHPR